MQRYTVFFLVCLPVCVFGQSSLVRNGGFEQLDDKGRALVWESSRIRTLPDGGHVLSVPFTWGFRQTVDVKPNARYLVSMDVKRLRGPSAARLVVSMRDKDGKKLTGTDVRHAFVGDDWETARGVVAASAEADHAIVYVLTLDKDKASEFLCDNVNMVALGEAGGLTGRVWQVSDPLYGPLLGDEPPGLVREGAMVWSHMLYTTQLRDVAARMGRRFSEDETYAHLAEHKLHPIRVPTSAMYAKHGVTAAIYPRYKPTDAGSMLEPRSIDFYLNNVRETLETYSEQIWAVFAQDEAEEHAIREILEMAKDPGAGADFLEHVEQDIRARYGFGRFGLPTGEGREEPFRWIAFRRWVNDRFRERHRRLSELVRENWPGVRLISTDPMGRLSPFEFSLQRDFFDIFTQQFLPRANPTRCPLGLYVKLIADVTGREVWPCVHVENYAYPTTPDEVRELYSQVWRNGGSGFHLYIPDTANARKTKGDTRLTQFGSPPRYRAILEIIERASTQNRLRFPPDEGCRILYANYAHMAFANPSAIQDPMEACYTLLGPHARSWFTILDEHRLKDPGAMDSAKAVYLPYARIMDGETKQRLEGFVRDGGTLIIGDPLAFEYDMDGTVTRGERERITGTTWTGKRPRGSRIKVSLAPVGSREGSGNLHDLMLFAAAYGVETAPGTVPVGTYEDGSAAVTLRKLGNGRVLYFAVSPFAAPTLAAPGWQRFFKSLQQRLGFSTGLDIWRFTFPPFQTVDIPAPEGQCLTANHARWRQETMHRVQNLETHGTYSLSPAPGGAPDDGGSEAIPFSIGDLTDRCGWPELEKVQPKGYQRYAEPLSKWVDTWVTAEPVTVTFDFNRPYPIGRVHLWFSGTLPALRIEGSVDGTVWTLLGESDGLEAGQDVLDLSVPTRGTPCRHVRLIFRKETPAPLTLAEVEIWSAGS